MSQDVLECTQSPAPLMNHSAAVSDVTEQPQGCHTSAAADGTSAAHSADPGTSARLMLQHTVAASVVEGPHEYALAKIASCAGRHMQHEPELLIGLAWFGHEHEVTLRRCYQIAQTCTHRLCLASVGPECCEVMRVCETRMVGLTAAVGAVAKGTVEGKEVIALQWWA